MAGETLLITGATGLVGSVLCRMASERGYKVRALVRSAPVKELARFGVEFVQGDVRDQAVLDRAAEGASGILHSAAVIGGTWSTATEKDFYEVNYYAVEKVLNAAEKNHVRRTVLINSVACLSFAETMTETSPTAEIGPRDSAYTNAKRAALFEGLRRASLGQDVIVVVPSAIYGPSPLAERACVPTSLNGNLLMAFDGSLDKYVSFPKAFTYVDDVAKVVLNGFEKGRRGARYLSAGTAEECCSLAVFCNKALAFAGSPRRVKDLSLADGAEALGAMIGFATRKYADRLVDGTKTATELDVPITPLDEGLRTTVDWLLKTGMISERAA